MFIQYHCEEFMEEKSEEFVGPELTWFPISLVKSLPNIVWSRKYVEEKHNTKLGSFKNFTGLVLLQCNLVGTV